MKIPARYVTGYIGDIRVPFSGPGDFSAWYQIWLDGRWWDMDARHSYPRMGRILMATGRDAADVAINHQLRPRRPNPLLRRLLRNRPPRQPHPPWSPN